MATSSTERHPTKAVTDGFPTTYDPREYDLTNSDVDEVVSNIEDLVSKFIMEHSPKFYDDDE